MKLKDYIIGIAIIVIDQIIKVLMINKNITLISNWLELNYTENTGGAFGVGTRLIVTIISILLIVAIIIFIVKEKNKINNYLPYTLILSGSIGNLIDRLFRGHVIDFIDIYTFPNFNVADICIVCGIFTLIIIQILKLKKT